MRENLARSQFPRSVRGPGASCAATLTALHLATTIRVHLRCGFAYMVLPDEEYMREALAEGQAALREGEVPVGAVVVIDGEITGRGHNSSIRTNDPTAHAEIVALKEAARAVGNYRLTGATLYSMIEPCAMCAGAIVHARIGRLVYGASDPRAGAVDAHFGVCTTDFLNHRVTVESGLLESECRAMLHSFFAEKRKSNDAERCESG
ncbi:MAG TPA: tRNA adenosine(34) deaminase TadA [Blastocatellia bacterium]|nr:tRNA adenosine(34) deaminase TadA [Blastocatellia bacterium]